VSSLTPSTHSTPLNGYSAAMRPPPDHQMPRSSSRRRLGARACGLIVLHSLPSCYFGPLHSPSHSALHISFVIKTSDYTGRKVFINVCGAPEVDAPGDWTDEQVSLPRRNNLTWRQASGTSCI